MHISVVFSILVGTASLLFAAEPARTPPDLTQGGRKDEVHDWLLGPTGARGWFFCLDGKTAASRQILITAVEKGSPADGILRVNDVILGVNGKPFADDARKSFGHAITAAEEKTGVLRLICWREGKTANVNLKLPVLGAYGDTAPYNSPKAKAIFEQGCRLIAEQGLKQVDIPMDFNALALLASGNKEYHPMLAEYARKVAASLHPGTWTWHYGYGNLFLAEYVLATGDKSILPELKRTAKESTVGQSAVGTWGHEFHTTPGGNLAGYGCMNQPGIAVTISLVVARQAGVNEPVVDRAIDKSAKFLRYYVNKGAIPYGEHGPVRYVHDDNGKCSSAAVLFDLLGDRGAAMFFSRMATAAYDEREGGHTGNVWGPLWALPAVSRGGPFATGAYLKEQSWYYELARNWKGGFNYQPQPAMDGNSDSYNGWDLTGMHLLAYGLPLKSLYLTGKKPTTVPPLNANEAKEVIAAGRNLPFIEPRTTAELLTNLKSWSPAMRYRSALILSRREDNTLPALVTMLDGTDLNGRYGALEALTFMGSRADVAAPKLRALLNVADPWMASLACNAIAGLGQQTRKACANDLLALAARKNTTDPRGMTQRSVAAALFGGYGNSNPILATSWEGVDRKLLYPAIASLLRNDDGACRSSLAPYLNRLTHQDLAVMLPAIVKATDKLAPSDEMFGDIIRNAGLDLLARLHIREGMSLCLSVMEVYPYYRWDGGRTGECLKTLRQYGMQAKEVLPQLKELRTHITTGCDLANKIDATIADIEASTNAPPLVNLKDFIAKASADASNNTKKEKQ